MKTFSCFFAAVALLGCSEGSSDGCSSGPEAVVMFAEPLSSEGAYSVVVTLDDGTSGECTIEIDGGERKNLVCSPSSWTLLGTSSSAEAEDDGMSSGYEADITGIMLDETTAANGSVVVKLDGTGLGNEAFSFDDKPLEDGCGTRPQAEVAIAGGSGGAGGSN